jgi:DNA-binding response OmpR family regulator
VCSKAHGLDGTEPRRILLLEDHGDTAAMMRRLLVRRGYHVVVASTIAEATTALRIGSFDLLLADLVLPDGCALELMRDLSRAATLPGIALSGHGEPNDIRRSREAGFLEHHTKPVNLEQLWASIDRVLAPSKVGV